MRRVTSRIAGCLLALAERTAANAGRLLATMQQKPVVELASVALAFVLARRVLSLSARGHRIRVSRQGPAEA
jgi:hypothetical protein